MTKKILIEALVVGVVLVAIGMILHVLASKLKQHNMNENAVLAMHFFIVGFIFHPASTCRMGSSRLDAGNLERTLWNWSGTSWNISDDLLASSGNCVGTWRRDIGRSLVAFQQSKPDLCQRHWHGVDCASNSRNRFCRFPYNCHYVPDSFRNRLGIIRWQ